MGQYHGIYNRTKKEYYSLGGAKLWEKAYCTPGMMGFLVLLCNSNGRGGGDLNNPIHVDYEYKKGKKPKILGYKMWSNKKQKFLDKTKAEFQTLENLISGISGRWAGDEIVVQGDYAKSSDPGFIPEQDFDDYKNITGLVIEAFQAVLREDAGDAESNEMLQTLKDEQSYLR